MKVLKEDVECKMRHTRKEGAGVLLQRRDLVRDKKPQKDGDGRRQKQDVCLVSASVLK